MSTVVKLTRPVTAHGTDVSELELRDPLTKDVIEIGLPTLIVQSAGGQGAGIEIRQPLVARYISRLAGIPMGSVEALSLADFSKCQAVVMGFFGTGDGETPAAPTS